VSRETNYLNWKVTDNWRRCMETIKEIMGDKKSLRRLSFASHVDRSRLMILDTWSKRYKLPVEWILEQLLRYYGFRNGRWVYKGGGLPVRISTLVSISSEEALREIIRREFPNDEHLDMWRQREQESILADMMEETTSKSILDFKKADEYATWYRKHVTNVRMREQRLVDQLKKSRPYRGNPFK